MSEFSSWTVNGCSGPVLCNECDGVWGMKGAWACDVPGWKNIVLVGVCCWLLGEGDELYDVLEGCSIALGGGC